MHTNKENLFNNNRVAIFTIMSIIVYFIVDGMGLFVAGFDFIENTTDSRIVSNMLVLHLSRLIHLAIVLFPVVFVALKYHVRFVKYAEFRYKALIPYLRIFLGVMLFYYGLTLGTKFSHEVFTSYYSSGHWFYYFRIVMAFVIFAVFVIDWSSAINGISRFPFTRPLLFKIFFIVCVSISSCMLLEFQVNSKMNMDSNMLLFNILYWIILQILIDVVTRTVKIGALVSLVLAYLIGLINDVVYQFRGNYVMYGDLTVVRTAIEVAGNYKYKPGVWFGVSLMLLIVSLFLVAIVKMPKHPKPTCKEVIVRAVVTVVLATGVVLSFRNGVLYNNVYGVGWDYNNNVYHTGYLAYFLSNMNSIKTVTLDEYDLALVTESIDNSMVQQETPYNYPNIIIIQNEAFSDLSVAYDIETNIDYLPFIHSLTDNTRKGYLNTSVPYGPTANTEFEVLMRSTLCFLPYGAVPYTQYVNSDLPSVAQVLRNQQVPYHTVAYHSYYSTGYRRVSVYDHFGFDEVYFEDNFKVDYPETDLLRDLMTDSADYRRVEHFYEEFRENSDDPWFCFNVTIQNHGGYMLDFEPPENDRVYVTNFESTDALNEYLSLIRVSDNAFRELIDYYSNCDEPTIIAMYGDHQPAFDNETLEILGDHVVDEENNHINNYYVPYVIWANFDIEEEDTLGDNEHDPMLNTLSANYFASTVFELAGIELTDYDRYLLDLHERVPAITAIGIWDNEGNYYSSIDVTPHADELSVLQMVQYNLIFDDGGRLTDRYE